MTENNCRVLGTRAEDADYIKQMTPIEMKMKELKDNKLTNPDEDTPQFRETARLRAQKQGQVKPL